MDQQKAIQELAILIREVCLNLAKSWEPEQYMRRINELLEISRKARDIDQTVRDK